MPNSNTIQALSHHQALSDLLDIQTAAIALTENNLCPNTALNLLKIVAVTLSGLQEEAEDAIPSS